VWSEYWLVLEQKGLKVAAAALLSSVAPIGGAVGAVEYTLNTSHTQMTHCVKATLTRRVTSFNYIFIIIMIIAVCYVHYKETDLPAVVVLVSATLCILLCVHILVTVFNYFRSYMVSDVYA